MTIIKVKLDKEIQKPHVGSETAAGADLKMPETMDLYPGDRIIVDSGISMEIPEGYFGLVVPRSGMGVKGLVIQNTVGIIDSDYRGNIKLSMMNIGRGVIPILEGERVAQIILVPHLQPKFVYVNELSETERGDGGFGSSGTK